MNAAYRKATEAAVRAGVKFLDKKNPGWWHFINLDSLRMETTAHCILGQCYRDFWQGLDTLIPAKTKQSSNTCWPEKHGFSAILPKGSHIPPNGAWEFLTLLWAGVIIKRTVALRYVVRSSRM